jgi:transposase
VIKLAKSKWESVKAKLYLVEKWARDGISEEKIAKTLGIAVSTLEVYKKEYPELSKSLKKGKESLITELENALIKKALGYDYEEKKVYTKTENGQAVTYTEITKKHQPPDTGALFGLLKNKDPEHYSDNPQMLQLKKQELELRERLAKEGNW